MTNPLLNKGTAFTEQERDALGLRGLLPPRVFTIEEQLRRVYGNFRRKLDPLEKYIFLTTLQNRNETLFYKLVQEHAEEMIPIIYTPTVGQACLEYGAIFRRPRGMFISIRERGRVAEILRHWPHPDVRMIVVTDGDASRARRPGRAGHGNSDRQTFPLHRLRRPSPMLLSSDHARCRHRQRQVARRSAVHWHQPETCARCGYDAFIDEFVSAVQQTYPRALLQWEDFGNTNAFRLLHQYRDRICSFNDDIQGTASVALAGIIAGLRLTGGCLRDQKLLFLGAGEAGTGIADLFVAALQHEGLSLAEARSRCWFVHSQGLVVRGRTGRLAGHKEPYAHEHAPLATLAEAVEALRPTALIGVSGQARNFTREILSRMASLNQRPIIFALSNPTSKAECTAEEAYRWTDGRAVFASGSPFPPVSIAGQTYVPGQGNNVYIFPGVGLGALVCEAARITDAMFLTAARTLACQVGAKDLALGRVYPALSEIREVSVQIAAAVAGEAHREGLARRPRPADIEADIRGRMFKPVYRNYV